MRQGVQLSILQPLLHPLNQVLDWRLVSTFLGLVIVILMVRHRNDGLLLTELGSQMLSVEQTPLEQVAHRWGQWVVHIFDQGFAGSPWVSALFQAQVRFILRWEKGYILIGPKGEQKAGEISRTWLLGMWCHRTGKRNRETPTPHYRLRKAISALWRHYRPPDLPNLNPALN
jgi:hypothetical protein